MVRFFYFCMLFCFPFSFVVSKSYFHADTLRMNKKTYYTVSETQKSNLVIIKIRLIPFLIFQQESSDWQSMVTRF